MSENSNKGGIFKGKSHAEGGIPFKIPETGQRIEVESEEPLISNKAVSDPIIRNRKGSNKEILTDINKKVGAKSMDEVATEVHAGDTIVCKKAMTDTRQKEAKGTDRQIVSAINTEAGCKEIEKGATMDSGGGVRQYGGGGVIKSSKNEDGNWSGGYSGMKYTLYKISEGWTFSIYYYSPIILNDEIYGGEEDYEACRTKKMVLLYVKDKIDELNMSHKEFNKVNKEFKEGGGVGASDLVKRLKVAKTLSKTNPKYKIKVKVIEKMISEENKTVKLANSGETKSTMDELVKDLYKDHHEAWDMMAKIKNKVCEENCSACASEIADAWEKELKHHFKEEEEVFFPSIRSDKNSQVIDELLVEHKWFLAKVEEMEKSPTPQLIKDFCEKLIEHIKLEEYLMGKIMKDPFKNANKMAKGGAIDKEKYIGMFSDSDNDGLVDVDSVDPFDEGNRKQIEEVSISKEMGEIIDYRNKFEEIRKTFVEKLEKISDTCGENECGILSRTKTPYSIVNKLRRRSLTGAKSLEDLDKKAEKKLESGELTGLDLYKGLTDVVGTMVVTEDKKSLDKVKDKVMNGDMGEVLEFEDFYENPLAGYRAYHFIIGVKEKDVDDPTKDRTYPIEVQLKTKRAKDLAGLSHTIYKEGIMDSEEYDKLFSLIEKADEGDKEASEEMNELFKNPEELKTRITKKSKKMAKGGEIKLKGQSFGSEIKYIIPDGVKLEKPDAFGRTHNDKTAVTISKEGIEYHIDKIIFTETQIKNFKSKLKDFEESNVNWYKEGGATKLMDGRERLYEDDNVMLEHNQVSDHYDLRDSHTGMFMADGGIIEGELEEAERKFKSVVDKQHLMKNVNSILRNGKDVVSKLKGLGLSDESIIKVQEPDRYGKLGFPSYALTNNNANLKRLEKRVNMLKEKMEGLMAAEIGEEEKYEFDGGVIEVNYPIDRVQILFPTGRTDKDTYSLLRRNGWVYSRDNQAFQRKITPQAIRNGVNLFKATKIEAKSVVSKIRDTPIEKEVVDSGIVSLPSIHDHSVIAYKDGKRASYFIDKKEEGWKAVRHSGNVEMEMFPQINGDDWFDEMKSQFDLVEVDEETKSDYEIEVERQNEQGLIDEGTEGISILGMMKGKDNPVFQQKTPKKYDIGFGSMGSGTTVWNRAEEVKGDYKIIAHISEQGAISYREENLPKNVIESIESMAKAKDTIPKYKTYEVVMASDDSVVISDGSKIEKRDFAGYKDVSPSKSFFEELKNNLTFSTIEALSFDEAFASVKKEPELIWFTKEAQEFVPKEQLLVVKPMKESYQEQIKLINKAVEEMPKTYGTDGIKDKTVYLHYFYGNLDWYIVEKDMSANEDGHLQDFGYADMGHGAELGYISIDEVKELKGVNLDFHFEPKLWSEIEGNKLEKDVKAHEERMGRVERDSWDFKKNMSVENSKEFDFTKNLGELGGRLIRVGEYPNEITFKYQGHEFVVFDNGGEFKMDDKTRDEYIDVIYFTQFGKKVSAQELSREVFSSARESVQSGKSDLTTQPKTEEKLEVVEIPANITKLINYLNNNKIPKEKAVRWNDNIEDENMAYRGHSLPKSGGETLWQVALAHGGSEMSVSSSGRESDIYWDGGDLLEAIKSFYKGKNLEVKLLEEEIEEEATVVESNFKGTDVTSYENPYQVNRAIESLIDEKGDVRENYSPEELEFMNYYSGYGGLEKFGATGKGLLYEYFTPTEVCEKMMALAYKFGYGTIGDRSICEPAVGTGNFLKYAPDNVRIDAYEINSYSHQICSILYPHAEVTLRSFEQNFIKRNTSVKGRIGDVHKYSLVIGNPPYGKVGGKYMGMGEKTYTKASNYTEYFITRGLDMLVSGGLLVYIVGAEQKNGGKLFLDGGNSKVKQEIFAKADLLDAYRLPINIFERTGVSSEILVFKKR